MQPEKTFAGFLHQTLSLAREFHENFIQLKRGATESARHSCPFLLPRPFRTGRTIRRVHREHVRQKDAQNTKSPTCAQVLAGQSDTSKQDLKARVGTEIINPQVSAPRRAPSVPTVVVVDMARSQPAKWGSSVCRSENARGAQRNTQRSLRIDRLEAGRSR